MSENILSRLILLIAPPGDSFATARDLLAAHPRIQTVDNAHVLTPLAYLGYYDNVHKAPYDHVLAAEAQRLFVEQLPRKEADYIDACRAYCERLYRDAFPAADDELLLDATPGYARILSFVTRILPDARYIVVTRHPLALLASGLAALDVKEHVRAATRHIAQPAIPFVRLALESMATDPRAAVERLGGHLNLQPAPETVAAAERLAGAVSPPQEWAQAFAANDRLAEAQHLFRSLPAETWAAYGYTLEDLWLPVETALGRPVPHTQPSTADTLQRSTLSFLRRTVKEKPLLNRLVRKTKLACDVLLRD